jgi:hypothetical protein
MTPDIAVPAAIASVIALTCALALRRLRRAPAEFVHAPRDVRVRNAELTRPCPACGARAGSSEKACGACGAQLPSRRLLCPKCGLMAGATGRFCKRCHTPIS